MIEFDTFASRTKELISSEIVIWLTTISRSIKPHPRPVWFIWDEQGFLIYSKPGTFKLKHIEDQANVSLNFNSDKEADQDVVIFRGQAKIVLSASPLIDVPLYVEKYREGIKGLGMTIAEFNQSYSVPIRVQIQSIKE